MNCKWYYQFKQAYIDSFQIVYQQEINDFIDALKLSMITKKTPEEIDYRINQLTSL